MIKLCKLCHHPACYFQSLIAGPLLAGLNCSPLPSLPSYCSITVCQMLDPYIKDAHHMKQLSLQKVILTCIQLVLSRKVISL